MEIRRLMLATALSWLAMVALFLLWHGVIMAEFYSDHAPMLRDAPLFRLIGLGYFVLATLMAVIYPKGYEGGPAWVEGVRFGLFIGILYALPRSLVLYGAEGCHTGTIVIVDAAWHRVEQGVGGLMIGRIHGGTVAANMTKH